MCQGFVCPFSLCHFGGESGVASPDFSLAIMPQVASTMHGRIGPLIARGMMVLMKPIMKRAPWHASSGTPSTVVTLDVGPVLEKYCMFGKMSVAPSGCTVT